MNLFGAMFWTKSNSNDMFSRNPIGIGIAQFTEKYYNERPNRINNRCITYVNVHKNVVGNNWGYCRNGTDAPGCGPQEHFRNCADISIL